MIKTLLTIILLPLTLTALAANPSDTGSQFVALNPPDAVSTVASSVP